MNYKLLHFVFIMLTVLCCCNPKTSKTTSKNNMDWNKIFCDVSGTIDSLNTKKLILELNLPYTKDTDGFKLSCPKTKYFLDNEQNLFIGCIDLGDGISSAFFELKIEKGEIIKKKYFVFNHGNYNCCTSEFNKFTKYSSFYTFEDCSTGSAYCDARLHFFKNIGMYNSDNSILIRVEDNSYLGTQDEINLSSMMQVKNDTIQIHYTVDLIIQGGSNSTKLKHKKKEFSVVALFRNEKLFLPDSMEFKKNNLDGWW